jgi:DNA-binding CsgD family transcriptional regulator
MSGLALQRGVDRIAEVSARGHDVVTLWREVSEVIAPLVPSYMGPCCYTLDPASLLITSHFNPAMYYALPQEMLESEYLEEEPHDLSSVARSPSGVSTLHEAAGDDLHASTRWRQNMELGGDQEAIVATRTRDGAAWGGIALYREPDRPLFSAEELAFLAAASRFIGEGLKRALLIGEAREPEGPRAPGLLVLSAELELESATPGTDAWLEDLPGGSYGGRLPAAVAAVAASALRTSAGRDRPGEVALSRVLSRSGTWVVLHGATLAGTDEPRVAVILEPAHPARIVPLLMAAYGLTDREQEVARLVLQGESTTGIAKRLVVTPSTVQEHLKHIFDKTGVRSRRDLVGKVFFAHYEPRLRDNEQRVLDGLPLRGGPAPGD